MGVIIFMNRTGGNVIMKPLSIAMMSMTHGHTRKYYQVLKENPKLN